MRLPPRGATAALAMSQLVAWGTLYYAYALLAPALATALETPAGVIALAFSGALVIAGLMAPMIGRWLDHGGARPVLLAGALVGPLALLAIAGSTNGVSLAVAFLLLGVAQALSLYESAFRAVVDWFPQDGDRRRALLVVTTVGGFASLVFVPLAAALIAGFGWRSATLMLAATLGSVALPAALVLPGRGRAAASPCKAAVPSSAPVRDSDISRFRLAFGLHACTATALSVSLVWHLVESGVPMMRAAFIAGLLGAAQVPGRLLLGFVQDVATDVWRLSLNFFGQAVALTVVAFCDGAPQVAAVVVLGALSGAVTLERAIVVVRRFGSARFSAASGSIATGGLVGRAGAPFLMAVVRSVSGYDVALAGMALLLVAAGVVFLTASRAVPATRGA